MIKVVVDLETDNMSLSMSGHADFNASNDIVCAGCSALYYALLGMLDNMGNHINNFTENTESGNAKITCSGDLLVKNAFTMATIGLKQIEKQYPDNVSVDYR